MTKNIFASLKGAACAFAFAATLVATAAQAQIVVEFPPPEFVATATPVYFEGHAAYWSGGRWYYRDGPGWHAYHDEPGYLHNWRSGHPVVERRYYEGRPAYGRGGGGRRR
jgi:hypothetical protein